MPMTLVRVIEKESQDHRARRAAATRGSYLMGWHTELKGSGDCRNARKTRSVETALDPVTRPSNLDLVDKRVLFPSSLSNDSNSQTSTRCVEPVGWLQLRIPLIKQSIRPADIAPSSLSYSTLVDSRSPCMHVALDEPHAAAFSALQKRVILCVCVVDSVRVDVITRSE